METVASLSSRGCRPQAKYPVLTVSIKELQGKVTEGTSALFLLTGQVTVDKVEAAFTQDERGELIQSNLSAEQEAKLREDFGAEV